MQTLNQFLQCHEIVRKLDVKVLKMFDSSVAVPKSC